MFYNMFLLDDVFASLSPSKSMFANVNFCNLPRDAGYWMRTVGIMVTTHYSYCSHYSHSSHKKSFAHHDAAVRKNFTIFAVQTDLKPPVGVRGLG